MTRGEGKGGNAYSGLLLMRRCSRMRLEKKGRKHVPRALADSR